MGIITTSIVALATLTVSPNIQFTSDSKYTSTKIINIQVQENINEEETILSKDLLFNESYVPGYTIYDNPSTPYIDGLKIDDAFVYDWKVENYDDSVMHTIHIKTVYTDDIAGGLAAAKAGDFSKVLSNPLIFIQLIYFTAAFLVLVISILLSIKNKIKKNIQEKTYQEEAIALAKEMVSPCITAMENQRNTILKVAILSQSTNPEDHVKMIELLEESTTQDINAVADSVKNAIITSTNKSKAIKEKAQTTLDQIAEGTYVAEKAATNVGNAVKESIESIKNIGDDGTSI